MELGEPGLSPILVTSGAEEQESAPNINDALLAIEAVDPGFCEQTLETAAVGGGAMFGGSVHAAAAGAPQLQPHDMYISILEQPASKALRFRYECEGRSAGSIPGARSTPENKTYPAIKIVGYTGRAVVVVSCVTKDKPYKPHPHNLVGKDLCRDGVCTTPVNPDTMTATFSNLGIQCVKKRDIEEALRVRESIRVDPFKTGFSHKSQPSSIDLNAVRLCFQVFLEQDGKFKVALPPVVSDVIYDKKAMSELTITRLSHCTASMAGGQEVILLCEKVAKEDISVLLYEVGEDGVTHVWEGLADSLVVHKQVAIAFRTPRYSNMQLDRTVKAYIQLKRPSDGATSDPRPFELMPVQSDNISRKRTKLLEYSLQNYNIDDLPSRFDLGAASRDQKPIKVEPRDLAGQYGQTSPVQNMMSSNLNVYRNVATTPSPNYHVPTPSPPLQAAYQYAPHAGDYSPQHWNIAADQQPQPHLQPLQPHLQPLQPLADMAAMQWPDQHAHQSNLFPQNEVSLSHLLHNMGDLRPLDSSDLAGISASLLQPDQDMSDSFSRLRTSHHDNNLS